MEEKRLLPEEPYPPAPCSKCHKECQVFRWSRMAWFCFTCEEFDTVYAVRNKLGAKATGHEHSWVETAGVNMITDTRFAYVCSKCGRRALTLMDSRSADTDCPGGEVLMERLFALCAEHERASNKLLWTKE